jgi:hypothetical protein
MKNKQAKMVSREDAYEIWRSQDKEWTWYVRKKWQFDDDKPFARWYCDVVSPFTPNGESGDVYVKEIKNNATKVI